MSIKSIIEGPKGVGKSTLIEALKSNFYADDVHAFSGQWEHLPTEDSLIEDMNSATRFIHDRGMLSHFIYTFLMPSDPDFNRVRYNGSKIEISSWRVPNLKMIEDYLNKIDDRLYILYTHDVEMLHERINRRNEEIGKGATEDEWKVLDQSNLMFLKLGEFLKTVFPEKIELIEVTRDLSTEMIVEKIIFEDRSREKKHEDRRKERRKNARR